MKIIISTAVLLMVVATAWAATCSNYGRETVCNLAATKDVWLEGSSNKNSYNFLIVGKHPSYAKKRFLVQFEDIPSTCRHIQWAKMYLYFWYAHKASWQSVQAAPYIARQLEVHQVKKSWSESQATTTYRSTGQWWSRSYLALDGTDAVAYSQGDVAMYPGQPSRYIEFDVTEAARNWKYGEQNDGLLALATNENEEGRDLCFYSRECATQRPFMTISCAWAGVVNSLIYLSVS